MGLRTGLDGCGKSPPPIGIRSPDRPIHSQSLYRLSYRSPHGETEGVNFKEWQLSCDGRHERNASTISRKLQFQSYLNTSWQYPVRNCDYFTEMSASVSAQCFRICVRPCVKFCSSSLTQFFHLCVRPCVKFCRSSITQCFSSSSFAKRRPSKAFFRGPKIWEVRECRMGAAGRMRSWFFFLLGRNFLISCCNFCSVCTYLPELTVSPLSKISTNKSPSPSQKTLAITSLTEVCIFGLFSLECPYSARFITLRFPYFWPPQGFPPRTPFSVGRLQPSRGSVTKSRLFSKDFRVQGLTDERKIVLMMKLTSWKYNLILNLWTPNVIYS